MPVCHEIINLFIKPQNFLAFFFIRKFKGLYLIVTVCDGLKMIFLHFVCKLLLSLWEHHIATMPSEVFCLRLLTSKNQFVHPFLVDVMVIFCRVTGLTDEVRFRNELCQLALGTFLCYKGALQYQRPWWPCHIPVPCRPPWHMSKAFH